MLYKPSQLTHGRGARFALRSRDQRTTIGDNSGSSGACGPYARGETTASAEIVAAGETCFDRLQKPLIVSRFPVAPGATGQMKWTFDGTTVNITSMLNLGHMYCPVGHQKSAPPHSCRHSFVRYQMYATERGSLAAESSCGKANSPGLNHAAVTRASPVQS